MLTVGSRLEATDVFKRHSTYTELLREDVPWWSWEINVALQLTHKNPDPFKRQGTSK